MSLKYYRDGVIYVRVLCKSALNALINVLRALLVLY